MNHLLSPKLLALRSTVETFTAQSIAPNAEKVDRESPRVL